MNPHHQSITRQRGNKGIQTDQQRSQAQQCKGIKKIDPNFSRANSFNRQKKSTPASNGDEGKRQQKQKPESTTHKERRLKSKPQLRGFNKPASNCKS